MSKTLVIAEKPSVAGDLAKVLGKFVKDGDFYENDSYVISSAVGHLLEIKPPDGFEPARGKWKIENLPSLPPEFALSPIEKNVSRLNTLKRLIKRKDITEIINACDAGREGELIFRNVVKSVGVQKPVKRLWMQSMTPDAIRTAFGRLRSDEEMRPLADAAVSRSEADWLVGINSTRALTAFNSQGGGFSMTTAGRCRRRPWRSSWSGRKRFAPSPRDLLRGVRGFWRRRWHVSRRWFDPAFQESRRGRCARGTHLGPRESRCHQGEVRWQTGHHRRGEEADHAKRRRCFTISPPCSAKPTSGTAFPHA
jgi:DNA topoisomerase-3